MNKFIEAYKCKDGWAVKITRSEIVTHEDEVYHVAIENVLPKIMELYGIDFPMGGTD